MLRTSRERAARENRVPTPFRARAGLPASPVALKRMFAGSGETPVAHDNTIRADEQWRQLLTPAQYNILRQEGTERPWSSPLNGEKFVETYVCAGCELPWFASSTKLDSGTGGSGFYDVFEGAVGTRRDHTLIWPRTEYCLRSLPRAPG